MIAVGLVLAQLLLGWLLADLLGGILHWLEDRYGRSDWPLIGRWVIAPNRLHHTQPLAFTRDGFWSRNSTAIAAAVAIAVPLAWIFGPAPWLIAAAIGGALTNQVHYWAHAPAKAPRLVRMLRKTGLLQSPAHHQRHHARPHDRHYCVLTDWLNPALDRLQLWAALARLLPRRWQA